MTPQDRPARSVSCSQVTSGEGSLDLSDAQILRPRYPFDAKEAPMLAGFEKEFIAAIAHITAFLQDAAIHDDLVSSVDAGTATIDEPETEVVVSAIGDFEPDPQPVHAGIIVAATKTPISSCDALSDGSSACESGSQSESESEKESTASHPSCISSTSASSSWSVVARAAHEIAEEEAAAAKARVDVPSRSVTPRKAIKKEGDELPNLDVIYGPFPNDELERPRRFVKWRDIPPVPGPECITCPNPWDVLSRNDQDEVEEMNGENNPNEAEAWRCGSSQ
ncbi:hypothetical protein BP6252_08865 [Coleophoma cylindrospora]|uniref:Uncharacterized protein n=1 Tax=Coleophoma cylindrospora TaxID=1849047 RepID=A0A3D8R719_9HELO|nr:hypothetical protein BP6252_08865 [Coleophoma cylindrospora]